MISESEKSAALLTHILGIFTGLLGPIILWAIKKNDSEFVNEHTRNAVNFQLSLLVYYFISFLLTFVLIGALGYFILPVLTLIFCIQGALKANKGELYKYPMTIRFIK